MVDYKAFVLAKNEESNIGRCVESLQALGLDVTVLDSGSSDRTLTIVENKGARARGYDYRDHCKAYNDITGNHQEGIGCIIIDADMIIRPALWEQATVLFESGNNVVAAPVAMICGGRELNYASLYPPKPFLFRGGEEYFRPLGHGEALKGEWEPKQTTAKLVHDDRKPYSRRLRTQYRYAQQLAARVREGNAKTLDWIRLYTPATVALMVPYILLGRFGFLDGMAGLQYAIERMISEAVIWRQGIRAYLDRQSPPASR